MMVARPESVPFDELNPSQILLEHGAGLHAAADRVDDDVFMHLSASPKQRCASYFNDAAPPSMRADELRWADRTAAAGLIARSPVAVHMLNSRLRHSISPMMEVYTHDVEDEDDGADGGRSGERTAEEDNDGDDATAVAAATAAAATGAQRPVAFARLPPPTAAIRIPTMPHVKRKWGYRDTPPDDGPLKRALDPMVLGETLQDREARLYLEKTGRRRGVANILDHAPLM